MRAGAPIPTPKGDMVLSMKKAAKETKFMKAAFDFGREDEDE